MPGAKHGKVCANAYDRIRDVANPQGLGHVLINDTFIRTGRNPDTYRGADVCFLRFARWPKDRPLPDGPLEVAPEPVVEVKSPADRNSAVLVKAGEYLAAGVTVVVVLDPAIDAATVYRETEEIPQRFSNGDELTLPDVLPGFAVPVRTVFA